MKTLGVILAIWSACGLVGADPATNQLPFVVIKNATGEFKAFRNGAVAPIKIAPNKALHQADEAPPSSIPPLSSAQSAKDNANTSSVSNAQSIPPSLSPGTQAGAPSNPLPPSPPPPTPSFPDLNYFASAFDITFEFNTNTINSQYPKQEVSKIPWPSGDWPLYRDGINWKWDTNEPPASEKYARANGLNATDFQRKVSHDYGLVGASMRPNGGACTSDADCQQEPVLNHCVRAADWATGLCVPRWYGVCDAWTSASIMEPEPKCPVQTADGTVFHVMDIKAILTMAYANVDYPFVIAGALCEWGSTTEVDKYGRFVNPSRRDVNPAVFHLLLTNIIGRLRKSLILDIATAEPVFNYALRSYEMVDTQMMKPDDAAAKFMSTGSYAELNPAAVQIQYVKMSVKYIHEGYRDGVQVTSGTIDESTQELVYEYLLELDANNFIIGGEWAGESKQNHPDVVWTPHGKPAPDHITDTGVTYAFASNLLQLSFEGTC